MRELKSLKVAIVHDYLRTFGGAERVLLLLHQTFPEAKIYMASADYSRIGRFSAQFQKMDIKTSFVQNIPLLVKKPILYRPFLPFIWKTINIGDVDVVISSSGVNNAKGIKIPLGAKHFCYCHTPPRYLYGLETETYYGKFPVISYLVGVFTRYLRTYDLKSNKNVDYFIANSKTVADRIKKYYKRYATIIYPSSDIINSNKKIINDKIAKRKEDNYFLVVSRLVKYKHIDVIIKAFNKLRYKLKIAGDGKEKINLLKHAGDNVKFLGLISDRELIKLYQNCNGLVVATEDEDFGLTPAEAQSYGKPVIAYYSGGLKESIIDGKTGIFFKRLNQESIISAVFKLNKINIKPRDCYNNSQKFSRFKFSKDIKSYVYSHLNSSLRYKT